MSPNYSLCDLGQGQITYAIWIPRTPSLQGPRRESDGPLNLSDWGDFSKRIMYRMWAGFEETCPTLGTCVDAKSLQSCPTLCDLMDYSPPGFSVHGIFQSRRLKWIVIPSSRGSSQRKDLTHIISCIGSRRSVPLAPPGKSHARYICSAYTLVYAHNVCYNVSLSNFKLLVFRFGIKCLFTSYSLAEF